MSALRPAAVAAEAGEDKLLGQRVPVEVDGHAEAGVEALADRDVRPEDPCLALVGSGIVLGVLGLGG